MQGIQSSSSHSSSDMAERQPLAPRQAQTAPEPAGHQQPSRPDAAPQPNVATPPVATGLLNAVPAAPQAAMTATAPSLAPTPGMHAGQKRAVPDGGTDPRDAGDIKRPRTEAATATSEQMQSRDAGYSDKDMLPHLSMYSRYAEGFASYSDPDGMDVDQPLSGAAASNQDGNPSPWQREPRLDSTFNAIDNESRTALLHAVAHGHVTVALALLARSGIKVNIADAIGNTALMHAVKHACSTPGYGHEALIAQLMKMPDIDPNCGNLDGDTPLLYAIAGGKKEISVALLGSPRINVDARDATGKTALMLAPEDESLIGSLLACPGIDVNARDSNGNTALILALDNAECAKARQLLRVPGIDVNAMNQAGCTAYSLALQYQEGAIAALLFASVDHNINFARQQDKTALALALALAAAAGDTGMASALLGNPGADVNATHAGDLTALMLAAVNGHEDMVRALLAVPGIDINAADAAGSTALMLAEEVGCEATVGLLLDDNGRLAIRPYQRGEDAAYRAADRHPAW